MARNEKLSSNYARAILGYAGSPEKAMGIASDLAEFANLVDNHQELKAVLQTVVFDEAQHLRYRAVEYIRHLWDERQTQVTMIFVGGNGCWDVLSKHPMLEARIWRPVQLQPLTPEQVLKLMPKYHAIYNDCDETLIETVDDRFAHGNFRKWAAFTATAADICAERKLSKVDTDVVEHGFWRHGGGTVDA